MLKNLDRKIKQNLKKLKESRKGRFAHQEKAKKGEKKKKDIEKERKIKLSFFLENNVEN